MSKPTKDWIQSLSGKPVYPLKLTADSVSLRDIPVALSRRKRFSGQTKEFLTDVIGDVFGSEGYSVAQHCVIGSELIDPAFALAFLLHEVSEVYLPDIPNPIKPHLHVDCPGIGGAAQMTWHNLEADHADVIMSALGLLSLRPLLDSPEVKAMDLAMLAAEKEHLMGPEPQPWGLPVPAHPGATLQKLWPWGEKRACDLWLARFYELKGRAA